MTDRPSSLRGRRARVESMVEHTGCYTLSAARFGLHAEVSGAIVAYANGDVLEAGGGTITLSICRGEVCVVGNDSGHRCRTESKHRRRCAGHERCCGLDLRHGPSQVPEHVPDPMSAMREFGRVLRPGGVLLLSASPLSMIHETPNDFFRFTSFGFEVLCDFSALGVVGIRPVGGPLSFLGHLISLGSLRAVGAIPGLFRPVWTLNHLLPVPGVGIVDRLFRSDRVLPRDYVLVARRP